MKSSAIIPTYNNESDIKECMDSLLNQSKKFDEIIVVDSNSSDKTKEIVKKYKKVKLIETGRGRSLARNVGWKSSKGDVICFIESDSVFNKDWLKYVLESFSQGADAVADKRRVHNPKTFISKMNNEIFKKRQKNYKPFSAWAFKREVLEKTGGFDESLEAAEDVDLGTRTKKAGYKIVYQPKSVQYHKGEPKNLGELFKREKWFGKNMKNYYEKYPEKFPWIRAISFSAFPLLFAIHWSYGISIFSALVLLAYTKNRKLGIKYSIANALISIPRTYTYLITLLSIFFS